MNHPPFTDRLVAFLRARLDEDEAVARGAHQPNWSTDGRRGIHYGIEDGWMVDALTTADADHIARHDPVRVLAEVDAKREVLALHSVPEGHECSTRDRRGDIDHCTWVMGSEACTTLRLLALPYAAHPDYREEWRP